ncbi:MAG: hypothetical protein AB7G88_00275, partial [Thermomicrobiales bacterium]
MRVASILFGLISLLIVAAIPASAQNEASGEPLVPDPAQCTLEPATRERLDAIVDLTLIHATPLASAGFGTPVTLPEGAGAPVSPELQAEIEEAMTINVACLNTGNTLLQISIYSDMGARRVLGEDVEAITDEEFAQLATPVALSPEGMTAIYGFGRAIDLGDGRVAIVIEGDDQSQPDPVSPT